MQIRVLAVLGFFVSALSFGADSYFVAPKSKIKLVDTQDIFRKNVDLSYEKPCWAEYVGVIEKIVWHKVEE